ncbi:hypothetical protein FISHEDRAFT_59733 [Fistulina hepatica ATCC 64428]|uniref:MYND-type domain-containing protein n=1 Tax=Fistulina hepatica ATCC 64428 TaxID=1128425 RepID=A0A0D7A9H3_9AGAR|nr:hypothetical protein FISHEDRAFT_59733 [Fistulina hepatica ATCC 64428]
MNTSQAVGKIKANTKKLGFLIHGALVSTTATVYMDLIGRLSPGNTQFPLKNVFLSANMISFATKVAVKAAALLNAGGPQSLVDTIISAFAYLTSYLESTDGFSWIIQSTNAGLLTAFIDAGPHLLRIQHPEDVNMIVIIVRNILPQYLVYRSVMEVWYSTLKNAYITVEANDMKGKGATCDNVRYQKVDEKNNFRKCAACQTSLYCSKEYQIIA